MKPASGGPQIGTNQDGSPRLAWTTAHQYMRELRRRYSFVSVYYIQDYEALFHPEAEYENRRDAEGHRKTVGGWCKAGLPWVGA